MANSNPPACKYCGEPVPPKKQAYTYNGTSHFQNWYNKFCSTACRRAGSTNGRTSPVGTRTKNQEGYVNVKVGHDHPYAENNGWTPEHRLKMMEHLGRRLLPGENVHHINGDRDENDIDNLELWTRSQPAGQRLEERPHCPSCSCPGQAAL